MKHRNSISLAALCAAVGLCIAPMQASAQVVIGGACFTLAGWTSGIDPATGQSTLTCYDSNGTILALIVGGGCPPTTCNGGIIAHPTTNNSTTVTPTCINNNAFAIANGCK